MNDFKNILIAWISSASSIFTAIETKTLITIVSAIILPILFFTIGKTIDVLLQIYFRNKAEKDSRTGRNI
ncbi:MAG: hypothetical protein ACR2M8_08090 [Pyrinomonadaceae bacterium]|nr:hypothetical protein [Blastocatellia bacterium]MDQ3220866.1 hypothetical protein [Acidobacteriota bacterium]MDQ3489582.1 hypothetical protein [Acidobacteriota bacterium]